MSFTNKVVIVTGASSGIGAASAILFAKEGANVVIVGRNEVKMKNVAAKIELLSITSKKPLVVKADVSKDDDAKRIIKQTIDKFGKLDVLVNNAGLTSQGSILDGKIVKAYDETIATNLRAVIHLTTLAAPHLISTKGNIINISSIAGIRIFPISTFLPYCVSKAGLDHFTRGAALELAPSGVRVNSVNPGPVRTDFQVNNNISIIFDDPNVANMTALARISEPEEAADVILFLASDKARGITGSIYVTDNGSLLK